MKIERLFRIMWRTRAREREGKVEGRVDQVKAYENLTVKPINV